jgi:hypothetical protein
MVLSLALPADLNWRWIWLVTASILAGLLNAVAGGGSFLLFPAMLGMRMLPVQANGLGRLLLDREPPYIQTPEFHWQ